jgi:tetratricopeptide (TPR) repeat protein
VSEETSSQILISSELSKNQILDYPTNPDELPDYIAQLTDILADSNRPLSSFALEFAKVSHNLANGDFTLSISKKFEQASRYYQAAAIAYQDLLNAITEGRYDDAEFRMDDYIKLELNWRLEYAKGRLAFAKGLISFESDPAEGQNQLQASADFFSKTVDLAGERVNYDCLFLSLGCFFQSKGFLLLLQSNTSSDPTSALALCYDSLTHLKKAKFVGQRDIDVRIKEIKEQIQELMISRIEAVAEACWNAGMAYAEEKKYFDSIQMLERGSAIYRGLQRLQNREDFVLQEKLLRVSALESHAKMLMDKDRNREAAEKFRRASFALRDVAEYVRAMDQEQLAENFETQKQYFEGMSTFADGIVLFDEEDVESALKAFKSAEEILRTTHENAKSSGNTILLEQCLNALNQVISYLETATALQE